MSISLCFVVSLSHLLSYFSSRYYLSNSGKRLGEQMGVVRTNCVDCLDRTNVTQSLLGRISLEAQLVRIGVFKPTELISQNLEFDEKYKVCKFLLYLPQEYIHCYCFRNADVLLLSCCLSDIRVYCLYTVWANHGDDISIQYSGTQALKGDFVRYGKRTFQGLIQDGFNALARYFYNNFTDGVRQVSLCVKRFSG
ncbi:hypothetical protein Mapa_016897 [Marchantia paleacea]|nr:hypothetical protein Mapa_016897 [Marchantia paleacea]